MNNKSLKHTCRIFMYALIITLFCSCSHNRVYDKLLNRVDLLMNSNEDSVSAVLKILHEIDPQISMLSKSQKMRYQLLCHKAKNKAIIPFYSDSIMLEVVDYYERKGSINDKILSYYLLGCVYRDMHDIPMALEYYNKAAQLADPPSVDCDYLTLSRVYGQMAVLFGLQHLPYQEMHSLDSAEKYAYIAKDTLNAIRCFENKHAVYVSLGKIDSAIIINNLASKMFREHGYLKDANIAYGSNSDLYLKKHNVEKAKDAFEHIKTTDYKGNKNYEEAYAYFLYQQGLYYLLTEKMDSAYISFTQSLQQCKSYSNKAAATRGLAQYYQKINNYKSATQYAILSSEYNDSDLMVTRNTQLQQMQAMYDYNRHKELASQAEIKVHQRTYLIFMLIACCITILIICFFYFRGKLNKKNQTMAIAEQLHQDSITQLRLAKEELAKLRDYEENAIPMLIQEKETIIKKLNDEINKYKDANICHNLQEIDELIKSTTIYEKLLHLEKHPQEKMTKEDWTNLMDMVEQYVYHFAVLKQKLSEKEYRICLLIKLRFTPSTISHFMETSLPDISLSRKRMLAKLCGKAGKAKDFDEYIHNIL